MKKKHNYKNSLKNQLIPAVVFGSLSGTFTAVVVMLYKFCAGKIIHFTEAYYHKMSAAPLYILPAVAVILAAALLYKLALERYPDIKGGGIPTSIALLRGMISFKWVVNVVYVFLMSLLSFFVGIPLGNEGPSVQMGTAAGKGVVRIFSKRKGAYDRYAMTGGACAGFSIATGAPISGMMFAVEEAHQKIAPLVIMVSAISVMFANITSGLLAPVLGVSTSLFSFDTVFKAIQIRDYWLPLLVGGVLGLFAVLFLKGYKLINSFVSSKMTKLPFYFRALIIMAVTLVMGIISFDFISTGHELTLSLFEIDRSILFLLAVLLVRSLLTLTANTNGITGGIFLPLISLGALVAAILGTGLVKYCGLDPEYYSILVVLGICGCISGMMKMPLTAVFFAVEALGCSENIIPVIIVAAAAYSITELFGVESINDRVIEAKVKALTKGKTPELVDTHVTVKDGAFVVGKQIRNVLWPHNLFVLSDRREKKHTEVTDEHGERYIHPGDELHVRYATYDRARTEAELRAMVE